MQGFYTPIENKSGIATFYLGMAYREDLVVNSFKRLEESLPIRWDCLKPNPLHELLYHSDCEGEIPAESCAAIADELEKLIPKLSAGDGGGHIGNWRDKTAQFVAGLRAAAAANEPLDFH